MVELSRDLEVKNKYPELYQMIVVSHRDPLRLYLLLAFPSAILLYVHHRQFLVGSATIWIGGES